MGYAFGMEFQRHILASCVLDKEFLRQNSDVIKAEYFNDDLLTGIAEVAVEFYRKEKEAPTKGALLNEIRAEIAPGRRIQEYKEELEAVYSKAGQNPGYYQGKAVEFARCQAFRNALRESNADLEAGEIDEIKKRIDNAAKTGDYLSDKSVYDYFSTAKERTLSYLDNQRRGNKDRVPTGIYPIDELIQGGLGRGELGVIIAPPGHGKTTTLVNVGASNVLQGKKVIYVTLELSRKMIASKFDTRLFSAGVGEIQSRPKDFAAMIKKLKGDNSRLHIIEYPTKSLTVDRLESTITRIGGADIILVDYGQLLRSSIHRGERRHEISDIFEGLRRMAGELSTPIWTAHQSNRPSINSKIIGMEHTAEDFNIVAISDLVLSVNQTEVEKREGNLRFYFIKNRFGPIGVQIDCSVNWKTACISVLVGDEELK